MGEDELLVDVSGAVPFDASAVVEGNDTAEGQAINIDEEGRPAFAPLKAKEGRRKVEIRRVVIPQNKMSLMKRSWPKVYPPLVEKLKLQVRMNLRQKCVEMRTSEHTPKASEGDVTVGGTLQKGADFVRAVSLGFDPEDALALLRLDDIYIETFAIRDVKQTISGDHISRAIGRICGKDGRTKFAIENATRTRIVLEDTKISIIGGYANMRAARDAVCRLIIGSEQGKIYNQLRTISSRLKAS